jgi:hypothetical protein
MRTGFDGYACPKADADRIKIAASAAQRDVFMPRIVREAPARHGQM